MVNPEFKKIQEMQRLNRIKENNDCLVCEVVITKELKEQPMSVIQGNGGEIEMAMMIKCLYDIIEALKRNFPETEQILPLLRQSGGGMKEAYKHIEMERRK